MTRPRTFTKAEMLDAARAAAEFGLCARLHPTGEIEFSQETKPASINGPTPEDMLEDFINGRKARGHS